MDLALLFAGGLMLYFGAEWLVGGASGLALTLRIPQLIVGLTVVAYGTSAPEVIVGVEAAMGGYGDVALGNVIGSNIANIGLILGIAVLVRPAHVDGALRRRELPVLLLSTMMVPLVLVDGEVVVFEGALLLLFAVAYSAWTIRDARMQSIADEARERASVTAAAADAGGGPAPTSRLRLGMIAVAGLAVVLLGGQWFVSAATALARGWGMSERVVGLTIVAIGTSLPELATSVIAAIRGHSDIAVGNVVGSNIFNVLLCLGAAGVVGEIRSPGSALIVDLAVLLAMTIAALVFLRTARTLRRSEGFVLLAGYVTFLTFVLVR